MGNETKIERRKKRVKKGKINYRLVWLDESIFFSQDFSFSVKVV